MSKRTFKGTVVSDSMNKTVVVSVNVPKKHRFYGKDIKITKNLKARDDIGVKTGDYVQIEETRPMGKTVNWKVLEKLEEIKE
jgi:small subunit ribosomal protein S17